MMGKISALFTALSVLSQLLQIIGALAILAAAYTYVVHRKQLNFDVITKCTGRFRDVMEEIESADPDTKRKAQRQYVDLCNEQLFYCGAGYLPEAVVNEWLDGMIDYLPQLEKYEALDDEPDSMIKKPVAHEEPFRKKRAVDTDLLDEYPRIVSAFLVDKGDGKPFDLDNRDQRDRLIKHVKSQIPRDDDMFEALAYTLKKLERRMYSFSKVRNRQRRRSRSQDRA